MIKIGIECENLEDPKSRWGIGQVTLNLLKEYAANPEWQKKYELYLYFKKRIPDDDIFKIQGSRFKIRILGFPSFNIFYHILMPLRAMADRLDWMFFPAYMLPPLYLGKSITLLTDDVYHEYKHGDLPFRYKLAYRLFTNWAAKRATKIMAISETSKKELVKLYGIEPERIFVNYLGISTDSSFAKALERYQQTKDNYLLFVGQMFPRRHAKETILAFKKIAPEFPNLKLVIVGKDKYNPHIIDDLIKKTNQELENIAEFPEARLLEGSRSKASGNERIIHYDYIEDRGDLERLYASAKALIYVSDREAFGLPPLEALALGIPPIIMDNELGHELFGARPEEAKPLFGDYAVFAKSGTVDDIEKAMRQAIGNPGLAKQSGAGKEQVENIKISGPEFVKKYSWRIFAKKFLENL